MLHNESRNLLVKAYAKEHNAKKLAEVFGVSQWTVYRLNSQMRKAGSVELRLNERGRKTKLSEADKAAIHQPMFKFSQTARKVLYTTNAIESLNSGYRRFNRGRSVFASEMRLLKALYLATWELTEKWTMPIHNWGAVYAELAVMYPGRLTGA